MRARKRAAWRWVTLGSARSVVAHIGASTRARDEYETLRQEYGACSQLAALVLHSSGVGAPRLFAVRLTAKSGGRTHCMETAVKAEEIAICCS